MNTLTLKIPEALDTALKTASAQRRVSKSALAREALERLLAQELSQTTTAANWLGQWRGALPAPDAHAPADERVAHILQKHLR